LTSLRVADEENWIRGGLLPLTIMRDDVPSSVEVDVLRWLGPTRFTLPRSDELAFAWCERGHSLGYEELAGSSRSRSGVAGTIVR